MPIQSYYSIPSDSSLCKQISILSEKSIWSNKDIIQSLILLLRKNRATQCCCLVRSLKRHQNRSEWSIRSKETTKNSRSYSTTLSSTTNRHRYWNCGRTRRRGAVISSDPENGSRIGQNRVQDHKKRPRTHEVMIPLCQPPTKQR
jgi:hypothetical protein